MAVIAFSYALFGFPTFSIAVKPDCHLLSKICTVARSSYIVRRLQMTTQSVVDQPLINVNAMIRSLGMWFLVWSALVLLVTFAGQPGVACITPLAWLLALPAGWNYVSFSHGKPGRQPFIAGAILGAILGLLYGLLFFG